MIVRDITCLVFFSDGPGENGFEVVDTYDLACRYQQKYLDDGYETVNIRHAASLNE